MQASLKWPQSSVCRKLSWAHETFLQWFSSIEDTFERQGLSCHPKFLLKWSQGYQTKVRLMSMQLFFLVNCFHIKQFQGSCLVPLKPGASNSSWPSLESGRCAGPCLRYIHFTGSQAHMWTGNSRTASHKPTKGTSQSGGVWVLCKHSATWHSDAA